MIKQLSRIVISVICMVVLSACGLSKSPTESLNSLFANDSSSWLTLLTISPDGEWYVNVEREDQFGIASVYDPQKYYLSEIREEYGVQQQSQVWSPDSSKIAVVSAAHIGKFNFDRVIIYYPAEDSLLTGYVFYLPEEGSPGIAWAPDGEKLLITTQTALYIIDDQAQLLDTAPTEGYQAMYAEWTPNGLFVFTRDTESKDSSFKLMWSKSGSIDGFELLWDSQSEWCYFAGFSEAGDKLLVRIDSAKNLHQYHVIDLNTREVIKVVELRGFLQVNKNYNRYVYGQIVRKIRSAGGLGTLYVFDWDSMEFIECGRADFLIGYYQSMEGFLVVNNYDEQSPIEIIKYKP
ncbi:MAG TPA: hypothetical protein PLA25_04185 [Anaerolineaceae bacterium]|nr:hypothetical protein [Anaerolineaceae bacterium]